ncbi:MAG: rRNA maturation RNase YbeY [Chloroflexota bacterium]
MTAEVNVRIELADVTEPGPRWFENLARDILKAEDVSPPYEVSIVLAGQQTVHHLNRLYRDVDSPTDVIAFYTTQTTAEEFVLPDDGVTHLGDVVISYPQAVEQAQEEGHSTIQELTLLVIHGLLHLLGYDHEVPEESALMRSRERQLLESFRTRYY